MISEEQLKKFEHQIEIGTLNCYQAVPALIAEVRRLEKEADYLAGCIEWCPDDVPMGACYDICSDNGDEFVPKEKCVQCWREWARKEVEGASNNA